MIAKPAQPGLPHAGEAEDRAPQSALILGALVASMQMLTRIPVPSSVHAPSQTTVAWSAVFYPAIGLLLGSAGLAVHYLLLGVLPAGVIALLILAVWALLTGALHEDGLADTFDAFGSQRSPDEILRVMKDSRIGVYGALALILSVLIRWQVLAVLPVAEMAFALLASQVISRTGIVVLAWSAGPTGVGSGGLFASSLRGRHVIVASSLAVAILLPLWGGRAMMAVGICALLGMGLRQYFLGKLGGVTGDCLGAAVQLQEIAVLLMILGLAGAQS